MKTVHIHDEHFATIAQALRDALDAQQLAIEFLSRRRDRERLAQLKTEKARYEQLAAAEEAFSENPGAWRRPKSLRAP